MATLDGGGTSRRRPQAPLQRRSYGAGPSPTEVFGWRPSAARATRVSTRLVRLREMRSLIWLLRQGGGLGFGATFEVCERSSLARVARAMRRLGRAALRLVCGFGAEWCMSGQRPRDWWCVCGVRWASVVWATVTSHVRFFGSVFLINRVSVWFLGSVFLINWVNSSSIRIAGTPCPLREVTRKI